MAGDLVLEVCDFNWNRLFVTPQVVAARISEELGTVGDGEVTIPIDDEAILYIPDPDSEQNNEGRWRLYEGPDLVFAGIVDQTTKRIGPDNTYTFGGKQRGILLGNTNVGRRDFNGWSVDDLFDEFTRDNIARSPFATIKAHTGGSLSLHPTVNAIIGDPTVGNYWAASESGSNYITIDLGDVYEVDSVRVIPPWWDFRWYKFNVLAGETDLTTLWGEKTNTYPLSERGQVFSLSGTATRYVRVTVTDSTDHYARLAAVLVYRKLANRGADTDFNLSWIENDDSKNVTATGVTARVLEQGAFNGDGVLGNSLVTRLSGTGMLTHRFYGTADSVYLTQGETGGTCQAEFWVDGVVSTTATISGSTYQQKAFEVTGLTDGLHTVSVKQLSGTPQVDYFTGLYKTAYRSIEDDNQGIGLKGGWSVATGEGFSFGASHFAFAGSGSSAKYEFTGDLVRVIGGKGPNYGYTNFYIDDTFVTGVDCYNATQLYQQTIFQWSGSYGKHSVMLANTHTKNASSTNYKTDFDRFEGNFSHTVFIRSFYETNLRMLSRMAEITNSWNRFNHDGSIDYLGAVGDYSGTVIREGENEGGNIINAEVQDDYSETCSAVLALVNGPNDLPIKAFVIDNEAVKRMGLKVRKLENADAADAYTLTRQAWVELQNHKYPARRYNVSYHDEDVGDVQVGETTILYSDKLRLDGSEKLRVGKKDIEYSLE